MNAPIGRRQFVQLVLGSASLTGFGALGRAARAQSKPSIAAVELRGGLIQLSGAGGNIVLLRRPGGGAMVDSGSPAQSAEVARLVAERFERTRVGLLFNTHWHLEHTGGNEIYGAQGAKILAHENTRLWMSTEYYVDWQDRTYPARSAAALPTDTFDMSDPQPLSVDLDNEPIEYAHLREAHTDGDIYLFFPQQNVLVTGGAVSVGRYPVPDHATGGWIGGLENATRKLLDMTDAETLIVPAAGPAQRRAHLEAQYQMVATVRGRIEDLMRQGRSAEEMLAAGVTEEFDAAWGVNRDRFVSNVYDGLWWQGRLDGSL